jgi:hypothetical protein
VRQTIAESDAFDDVLDDGLAALARPVVDDVQTIRTRPVEGAIAAHRHGWISLTVVERHLLGDGEESPLHDARRNADQVAVVHPGPRFLEQLDGLREIQPHSDTLQDFQAGLVHPAELLLGKTWK